MVPGVWVVTVPACDGVEGVGALTALVGDTPVGDIPDGAGVSGPVMEVVVPVHPAVSPIARIRTQPITAILYEFFMAFTL